MPTKLSYRVLGPLEVSRGGRVLTIRAGKHRSLLAALLVSANRLVPVDELVERLWGQNPPPTARATLATYVMRLRRILRTGAGDEEPRRDPIRTRPEGYLIDAAPEQVDLGRFDQLLAEADRHPHDPEAVLGLLADALRLWRGPALVDIPSESLQRDVAPRLEEQRLHTIERRIDTELALGRHAELVGELTALTTEHRLRERFWHQLMLALYRSRRQPDALDAYGRLRALLIDEMGLEPSTEIRALHLRILAEDPTLHEADGHVRHPAAVTVPATWLTLCQLPPDLSDFVGRSELIAQATSALLPDHDRTGVPVVAITGAPGTGKSAVAVRIAHSLRPRFPDGQLFVRLTGVGGASRDPAEVLGELLTASGLGRDALPEGLEARAAAFRARLADRKVLLVLDDAARSSQVVALLPGTASCAVLVTGRRMLSDIPGAVGLRLDSFVPADALDLLARLAGSDRVAEEPAAARAIVDACGGLPLAVRIVGARLAARPLAGLAGLAERLADEQRRLDELRTGDLEVRAGLALSYSGLSASARTAFRRLGLLGAVDVAAWTVGVLAARTDGEPSEDGWADGERLVEELVEANLLTETGRDPTGEARYRPHDLIALYAGELARADDDATTISALRCLMDALLGLADAAHQKLSTVTIDEAPVEPADPPPILPVRMVDRLTADGEAWLLAEQPLLDWAIRRCVGLGWYVRAALLCERALARLDIQLPHAHVVELLDLVAGAAREAGDERVAWRATWQRSMQMATRQLTNDVLESLAEAARVFDRLDAPVDLAYALASLAYFHSERQDRTAALSLAEKAVAAARGSGHRPAYATSVREFASLLAEYDRYDEAVPLFDEALAIARDIGGPVDEALVLHRITRYALEHGDLDRAAEASQASLDAVAGVTEFRARAYVAAMAARVASARGEGRQAVVLAERAREEFGKLGDRFGEVAAIASLAEAYLEVGRADDVIPLVDETLPAFADVGATRHVERLKNACAAARRALGGQS
ncbi:BTAD domain-containing putative transcriptional regulator [Actinopolymorpha sp. B17G11]|uniref:AfsR/SARP family transcriptional regulator n=1 Tax=Actinopolymorpha sp. B17G11 TaxID=3160861 RepID=UPI0032E40C93